MDAFGFRVLLLEAHDVLEVRPAPRIDALGIVTHDHDLAVFLAEEGDDAGLDGVGVLVFIHEDVEEFVLVVISDGVVFLEEF